MASRRNSRKSFSLDNGARIPVDSTCGYTVTSDGIITPVDAKPFGASTVRDLALSLSPEDRGLSEQGMQMIQLRHRLTYFPANCLKSVINLGGLLIAYVDEQAIDDSESSIAAPPSETGTISSVTVAKLLAVALTACLMAAIAIVALSGSSAHTN